MCNSNKQSTTSEYSGIVPLSLIIKKDYKTSKLLESNSMVPFLELGELCPCPVGELELHHLLHHHHVLPQLLAVDCSQQGTGSQPQ